MRKQAWYSLKRLRFNGFRRLSYPIRAGLSSIPIILVLLAILLPVLCMRPHSASQSSCLSNEKQVCFGMLQYVQDYDETWPVGTRNNLLGVADVRDTPLQAKFHAGQGWAGAIYPYTKNYQIFQCPEDEAKAENGLYPVTYAYNRNMALKLQLSDLSQPGVTIVFAETAGNHANLTNAAERSKSNVYSAAGNGLNVLAATDGVMEPEASAGARYVTGIMGGYGKAEGCALWPLATPQEEKPRHHDRGTNYALADGHSKFCEPSSVSPGDDAANAKQAQDCAHGRAAGTANLGGFNMTFSSK